MRTFPGNGPQALQIMKEYKKPIHLLITDVVMPKINGRELMQEIIDYNPEIKVMFISGYTENVIARNGILEEQLNFLQKPFSPKTLLLKIHQFFRLPC